MFNFLSRIHAPHYLLLFFIQGTTMNHKYVFGEERRAINHFNKLLKQIINFKLKCSCK